jgi:hypothetical protein
VNLSVKKFDKTFDYEIIKIWFSEWEWSAPELDQIPEESWIAYVNEIPVAFSCFGKTDTSIAIMGFTIARKNRVEGQSEALDRLIEHIFSRVKECGFKYLHYYTDSLSMVNRMEKLGMEVTDRGTAYILLKNISGNNHKFYDE